MKTRTRSHRFHFESLEQRLTMAGNVTVNQVGTTLTITGDHLPNRINITGTANPGEVLISSYEGTTMINGGLAPVLKTGVTSNITIQLLQGDDVVTIKDLRAYQDLTINGNQGRDRIEISDIRIGDDLAISTHENNDTVELFIATSAPSQGFVIAGGGIYVGDTVVLDTGSENDSLRVNGAELRGTVTTRLGLGNDSMGFFDSTARKTFILTAETGNDIISFNGFDVLDDFTLDSGSGSDEIEVLGGDFGGDVSIITGIHNDKFDSNTWNILGSLFIDTGAGYDRLLLDRATIEGTTELYAGSEDDIVSLALTNTHDELFVDLGSGELDKFTGFHTTSTANVVLIGGEGVDEFNLNDSDSDQKFTIDFGAGADSAYIVQGSYRELLLLAGAGNDIIGINNSSTIALARFDGGVDSDYLDKSDNNSFGTLQTVGWETIV